MQWMHGRIPRQQLTDSALKSSFSVGIRSGLCAADTPILIESTDYVYFRWTLSSPHHALYSLIPAQRQLVYNLRMLLVTGDTVFVLVHSIFYLVAFCELCQSTLYYAIWLWNMDSHHCPLLQGLLPVNSDIAEAGMCCVIGKHMCHVETDGTWSDLQLSIIRKKTDTHGWQCLYSNLFLLWTGCRSYLFCS